jgi:hypothetical protein
MARKIVNRKQLREEAEAAERLEALEKAPKEAAPKKATPKKKAPAKPRKPAKKRASRAKVVKEVRLKAFWGVYHQSLRRVALFEYGQRKQADKKAEQLSASQKAPHFVQLVKEVIEESSEET